MPLEERSEATVASMDASLNLLGLSSSLKVLTHPATRSLRAAARAGDIVASVGPSLVRERRGRI